MWSVLDTPCNNWKGRIYTKIIRNLRTYFLNNFLIPCFFQHTTWFSEVSKQMCFSSLVWFGPWLEAPDLSGGISQFVQFLPNWAARAVLSPGLIQLCLQRAAPGNGKPAACQVPLSSVLKHSTMALAGFGARSPGEAAPKKIPQVGKAELVQQRNREGFFGDNFQTSGTSGSLDMFHLCQPGEGNHKASCAHPGAHVFVSLLWSWGGIAYKPQRAVADNLAQWGGEEQFCCYFLIIFCSRIRKKLFSPCSKGNVGNVSMFLLFYFLFWYRSIWWAPPTQWWCSQISHAS